MFTSWKELRGLLRHELRYFLDQLRHAEVFREAIVVQEDAVREDLGSEMADVFEGNMRASFRERTYAGGPDERLDRAG